MKRVRNEKVEKAIMDYFLNNDEYDLIEPVEVQLYVDPARFLVEFKPRDNVNLPYEEFSMYGNPEDFRFEADDLSKLLHSKVTFLNFGKTQLGFALEE